MAWTSTDPETQALLGADVTSITGSSGQGMYSGNDFTVLGDSITSVNASTANENPGHSWHTVLAAVSNGRLRWRKGGASGGFTAQDIRDTHLPEVLSLNPAPAACIVFAGTNNVGSGSYDLDVDIPALVEIYDGLESAGIRPIAVLITPRNTATDFVPEWNRRVLQIAQDRNYDVLDFFSVLVDPSDGSMQSEFALDGSHPNNLGHTQLGEYAWSVLSPRFPSPSVLLTGYATDAGDLLGGGGFFLADSNADGRANGWNGSGSPSIVTDGNLNWQRMTHVIGVPNVALLQRINIASGFVAGDTLELSMRMRIVGRDPGESLASGMNLEVRDAVSGGSTLARFGASVELPDGEYVLAAKGTLPAGSLGLRVNIQSESPSLSDYYIEYAQVGIRNLTAIGAE
ncbi:MAG: GDSL-type esterase/lipase family protein [Planctomycetota bacterium]